MASILAFIRLDLGMEMTPNFPLIEAAGGGMSLILKITGGELITVPSLVVPETLMATCFPLAGFKMYFVPFTCFNPTATALTLLSETPGMEMVMGFSTPR